MGGSKLFLGRSVAKPVSQPSTSTKGLSDPSRYRGSMSGLLAEVANAGWHVVAVATLISESHGKKTR